MPWDPTTQRSRGDCPTNHPHTRPSAQVSRCLVYAAGISKADFTSKAASTLPRYNTRSGVAASHQPTGDQAAETGAKRKRSARSSVEGEATVLVNHVLQLPGKRAFNPWFLHLLRSMTASIEASIGRVHLQKSWFDLPSDSDPQGDGHEEGFTLPTRDEVSTRHHVHDGVIDMIPSLIT